MRHLLLAALLVACGGDGGGTDGGGDDTPIDPVKIEDYTDAREAAECDHAVACEQVVDRATCDAANILVNQEQKSLLAAVADGTVTYDGVAAKKCLEYLSMLGCAFAGFHVDNPCDDIFKGTVAGGGACYIDLQCANRGQCNQNDGNCDTDVSCCIGTCAGTITESQIGGPCGNNMNVCSNDSYCKANVCTALVTTEGGTCDALEACSDPMFCAVNLMTGMGICKTPAATGAACVRTDARPCSDTRDYCDPSNQCARSAAPGTSCANATCVDYAKCIQNTCVADLALGATCMTTPQAADCAGTLECLGGTCAAPPAGMTCAL